MKPIIENGKVYRIRRGKKVEIPTEWVGKVTCRQTINKRPSKSTRKARTRRESNDPVQMTEMLADQEMKAGDDCGCDGFRLNKPRKSKSKSHAKRSDVHAVQSRAKSSRERPLQR